MFSPFMNHGHGCSSKAFFVFLIALTFDTPDQSFMKEITKLMIDAGDDAIPLKISLSLAAQIYQHDVEKTECQDKFEPTNIEMFPIELIMVDKASGQATKFKRILKYSHILGGLIISDSLNHNSIVNGARVSGAAVCVFQHNNPAHLEKVLRKQIAKGQPRKNGPWKGILVIVEGMYSMEGEFCKLPEIIAICKKYKAYTYKDEAHGMGVVGKTGRGVCELLGVDPADIDIMMGTLSKSFGSCGGYIAASKEIVRYLKHTCPAHLYATSMSPPAVEQAICALKVILGEDGSNRGAMKLAKIRENSNFIRSELKKMGFEVLGDNDSPVMPIMLYNPAKVPAFSRECLINKVAVVVVAFPAVPLLLNRARFCISASHSREDLVKALEVISNVGDLIGIEYLRAEREKTSAEENRKKLK